MSESELGRDPGTETEKPIDFSKLNLWMFSRKMEKVKDVDDVAKYSAFARKGTLLMDGEVFNIDFFLQRFVVDKITREIISFCILKGRDIMLNGLIEIEKGENFCQAITNIKRNNNKLWRNKLRGKGVELYKKMLVFLQRYSDENNYAVAHVIRKISDLSDVKWHKIFDSVFEERGYQRIENGGANKWEKTYLPSKEQSK